MAAGLELRILAEIEHPEWTRFVPQGRSLPIPFIEVALWQWLSLLLIVFIGVVINFMVRRVLHRYLGAWTDGRTHIAEDFEDKTSPPFGLAAMGAFLRLAVAPLRFVTEVQNVLYVATEFILIVGLVWGFYRLVALVYLAFEDRAEGELTATEQAFVPLLVRTLRVFIVLVGVLLIAETLRFDVTTLLAGLGIGSLAIALAAGDTIRNFFGSLTILLDRPFGIGDWVIISGMEGTVEEIGFRTTKLRTFQNSVVVIPNSIMVDNPVENMGMREYRRYSTRLGILYSTPPETIQAFVAGISQLIRNHPHTRKDYYHVRFNDFGDSALQILLYVFWKVDDWTQELRERERLLLDIMRLAGELDVEFAFPSQSLYLEYLRDEAANALSHGAPDSHDDPKIHTETEAREIALRLVAEHHGLDGKTEPEDF